MIEQSLAGPIGTIVKVSTLQDYGVDKFYFLESNNVGTNQRSVVFLARGESARHAQAIAGKTTVLMMPSTAAPSHAMWPPYRAHTTLLVSFPDERPQIYGVTFVA